jgi:hypothetical protein
MYHNFFRHSSNFSNNLVKLAMIILILFFVFVIIIALKGDKNVSTWTINYYLLLVAFLFFAIIFKIINDVFRGIRGVTHIASDVVSQTIVKTLRHYGLEEHIIHFIDQHGLSNGNHVWRYKNYSFDWTKVNELKEYLIKKGVKVTEESLQAILIHYIENKEQIGQNPITQMSSLKNN